MLAYSVSADSELQFWASALLLNMAMTSDDVKKEIIMLGGLKPLMELAIGDSDHPQCSTHAAKTLVMLGFLGELYAVKCSLTKLTTKSRCYFWSAVFIWYCMLSALCY